MTMLSLKLVPTGLANWFVIRNYKCLFMLESLSSDLITTTNTNDNERERNHK